MDFSKLKFGLVCGAMIAIVCLSGCGSVQNVPVEDNASSAFAVRGTFRPQAWARAGRPPAAGIEVGYEGYRAKGTQTLAAGQSIELPGGSISGPDTLNHQADLKQAYVAYNHLIRFGSNFQLEPFVGLARVHVKINTDAAASALKPTLDEWHTGFMGGITPRWRFNDWAAAELRMSIFTPGAWVHGQSYEAAVVLRPVPEAALRLGYSERRYDVQNLGLYSEVNVRARGPMATLQFDF